MNYQRIIGELSRNKDVFKNLLDNLSEEVVLWKPAEDKWCLLEIVCHLLDEEREDFYARVKHVLERPNEPMTPIDPVGWVTDRNYIGQDFKEKLNTFLLAREQSVTWLQSLESPEWDNTYQHPKLGAQTANMYLSNWLAHDYMHIRQTLKVKFAFLQEDSGEPLSYAGKW